MKKWLLIGIIALSSVNVFAASQECEEAIKEVGYASIRHTLTALQSSESQAIEGNSSKEFDILEEAVASIYAVVENAFKVCK